MNPEAKRRRQSLKVLISEAIMVIAVAITVIILALLVSGYWLNSNLEVERQGMLQVSSVPTGADVMIDNESSWLQRTNTSKVLSAGEHTITLTKDGYDSWSKTINITEGLLYRLHYPRLFLQNRESEDYLSIKNVTYATVSPDRDSILLINNTTQWSLVRLSDEKPEHRPVDVSGLFSNSASVPDEAFASTIVETNWSRDGSHLLFKIKNGDALEWVLLDVKNSAKSINLTREFGNNFSEIQILDNSANNLLAVQNGNLHRIDTSARSLSAVIVDGICSFDHFENEIVFTAASPVSQDNNSTTETTDDEPNTDSSEDSMPYYVGLIKLGDDKMTKLLSLPNSARVAVNKFYDEKYLTLLSGSQIKMYQKNNLSLYAEYQLGFEPKNITVGHDGEFILVYDGPNIASIDMEANDVSEWSVPGTSFGWLDNNMVYSISDGELSVYDYDGLNHRTLAHGVSANFPVTITGDKWLYYFSNDSIIREWIVEY